MTGRRWIPVLALLVSGVCALPAQAEVKASARLDATSTTVGQAIQFSVVVVGDAKDIRPPEFPEIDGVDAYGAGQSQRFSFVNGQSTAEYSWSWSIVPRREGEFTIPEIEVSVAGDILRTSPRTFTATAATGSPVSQPGAPAPVPGTKAPDAFVAMRVNRDSVVVGEQVLLTFSFYQAARTSMFESPSYTAPRSEGFWREDLPPETHRSQVIRSRRYEVTEIRYALFPTRTGDLTISEATVHLPDDAFGSFFRRNRRRGPEVLQTDPITVHVQDLPRPVPADFTGTVGSQLRLESEVEERELAVGDALTWRVRLSGTGHLEAATMPTPDLGPEFTVHEAGTSSGSSPEGDRLVGSRTVEYLLIPQQAGPLSVPPLQYSYFDTGRREYVRLRTEAIALRVAPGEGTQGSVFTGGRKSEIELLARDILYIEGVGEHTASWSGPLPARPVFWGLLAGMPLAWAVSGLFARRRQRLLADPRRLRARSARARARAVLQGEGQAHDRVARALSGYLADRFDRSASGLVRDEIEAFLIAHKVSAEKISRTLALLDRCDAARFAPSSDQGDSLVDNARNLIDDLEEDIRAS